MSPVITHPEIKPSDSKFSIILALSQVTLESLVSTLFGKRGLKEWVTDRGVFCESARVFPRLELVWEVAPSDHAVGVLLNTHPRR